MTLDAEAWRDQAACDTVAPGTMFPDETDPEAVAAAKRVCAGCDVQDECLRYALAIRAEYGVWGGLSESDRRKIVRRGAVQASMI